VNWPPLKDEVSEREQLFSEALSTLHALSTKLREVLHVANVPIDAMNSEFVQQIIDIDEHTYKILHLQDKI